jgi:hypothetical protein
MAACRDLGITKDTLRRILDQDVSKNASSPCRQGEKFAISYALFSSLNITL